MRLLLGLLCLSALVGFDFGLFLLVLSIYHFLSCPVHRTCDMWIQRDHVRSQFLQQAVNLVFLSLPLGSEGVRHIAVIVGEPSTRYADRLEPIGEPEAEEVFVGGEAAAADIS